MLRCYANHGLTERDDTIAGQAVQLHKLCARYLGRKFGLFVVAVATDDRKTLAAN